jgi:hypothetical protein
MAGFSGGEVGGMKMGVSVLIMGIGFVGEEGGGKPAIFQEGNLP